MLLVAGAMLEKRSACHAYYDAMEDVNKQTNTRLSCESNNLAVLVLHVAKPSDYNIALNFYSTQHFLTAVFDSFLLLTPRTLVFFLTL